MWIVATLWRNAEARKATQARICTLTSWYMVLTFVLTLEALYQEWSGISRPRILVSPPRLSLPRRRVLPLYLSVVPCLPVAASLRVYSPSILYPRISSPSKPPNPRFPSSALSDSRAACILQLRMAIVHRIHFLTPRLKSLASCHRFVAVFVEFLEYLQ